jgi:hypothetical protein
MQPQREPSQAGDRPQRIVDLFRPTGDASPSPAPDRLALFSLIAANLLPILIAVLLGWDMSDVVLFYWLENIIIGLWVIPRMLFAQADGAENAETEDGPTGRFDTPDIAGFVAPRSTPTETRLSRSGTIGLNHAKFFLVPFFCFHYFFFCFVHGIFITVFTSGFAGGPPMHSPGELLRASLGGLSAAGMLALAGLVISHGISFFRNYVGRGEYRRTHPMVEMFRPYPRIVILHVCIIFGGFAIMMLGSPMPLVVLLMIGKTLLDATLHTASHGGKTPWGHPG